MLSSVALTILPEMDARSSGVQGKIDVADGQSERNPRLLMLKWLIRSAFAAVDCGEVIFAGLKHIQ